MTGRQPARPAAGRGGYVLIDFLIICKFAGLVARLRGDRGKDMAKPLAACQQVAAGRPVRAVRLIEAQRFAGRWWANLGMALIASLFPLLAIAALFQSVQLVREIAAWGTVIVGFLGASTFLQVAMQTYRSAGTHRVIRRTRGEGAVRPLPPGSLGLPRRRDFWVAAAFSLILLGGVAYLGFRARGLP